MNKQELYEKIRDSAFETRKAVNNTGAPGRYIDQMKNILYNNLDAIEDALKYAAEAEKQIQVLEVEIADAERELDELTKKKTTKQKKSAEEP